MGGLGKTRLSLQVAAELMHAFPDGVWFLDLAPLRDDGAGGRRGGAGAGRARGARPAAAADGLRAPEAAPRADHLDNCEHLVKPSAELAHAILRAAPHVRILASSREALHVPGEQSYPVLPLPLPARGAGIEALSRSPAVRLFVERAQQHKPSFALNGREAPAVAELVARLEGIPLALELAAARVRSLTVADINARLKDRYKILTGGARVLQERQQTLRALVDWSYDLLTPQEQTLLGRLGVFVGGFDLAAAEQVCGADPLPSDDVLDLLASLVEKSLVMLDERDDGARYRMLETIRDYAREKLEQSGELTDRLARHCEHYFAHGQGGARRHARARAGGVDPAHRGRTRQRAQPRWRWRLAGGVDPFIAVKFAVALQGFWILRGYATEGRSLVRAALALPAIQASDLAQAWALYVGGGLAESQSDYARGARDAGELPRVAAPAWQSRRHRGHAVDLVAGPAAGGDAAAAAEGEREALQIFRQTRRPRRRGDRPAAPRADGRSTLGDADRRHGSTSSKRWRSRARSSIRKTEGECELRLGEVAFASGDHAEAELWFKRSLTVCREAADKRGEANALRWLGKVRCPNGALRYGPGPPVRSAACLSAVRDVGRVARMP